MRSPKLMRRDVLITIVLLTSGAGIGLIAPVDWLELLHAPDPATVVVSGSVCTTTSEEVAFFSLDLVNNLRTELQVLGLVRADCSVRSLCRELPLTLREGERKTIGVTIQRPPLLGRYEIPFLVLTDRGNVSKNCVLKIEVEPASIGQPTLAPPMP